MYRGPVATRGCRTERRPVGMLCKQTGCSDGEMMQSRSQTRLQRTFWALLQGFGLCANSNEKLLKGFR